MSRPWRAAFETACAAGVDEATARALAIRTAHEHAAARDGLRLSRGVALIAQERAEQIVGPREYNRTLAPRRLPNQDRIDELKLAGARIAAELDSLLADAVASAG